MLKDVVDREKIKVLEQINKDEKNNKNTSQTSKKEAGKELKPNNSITKDKKTNDTNLIIGELDTCEKLSTSIGREIKLAVNSESVKEEHYAKFGKKTYTRFPPEPNG